MRHWKQGLMKGSETREETSPLNSSLDLKATKTMGRVGSFMRGKPKPAQKVALLAFRGLITSQKKATPLISSFTWRMIRVIWLYGCLHGSMLKSLPYPKLHAYMHLLL